MGTHKKHLTRHLKTNCREFHSIKKKKMKIFLCFGLRSLSPRQDEQLQLETFVDDAEGAGSFVEVLTGI